MKSSSADPDFVRMSRFSVAMEAWLRPIRSATMAGSVSIGAGRRHAGARPGPSSGSDGMKSPRSRMVSQRVPDQRIASSHDLQEAGSARWRRQVRGDIDEQPPTGHVHRPRVVSCQKESPRGFMASVIIWS